MMPKVIERLNWNGQFFKLKEVIQGQQLVQLHLSANECYIQSPQSQQILICTIKRVASGEATTFPHVI